MSSNKKNISKIIALIISVIFVVSSILPLSVFADDDFNVTVTPKGDSAVHVNDVFGIQINLDFDEEKFSPDNLNGALGIMVFNFHLKFDPNYIEVIDPNTLKTIEADDDGNAKNGASFFDFNDNGIGADSSCEVTMTNSGDKLFVFYGNVNAAGDIFLPGDLFELGFRVKDIDVNESITTSIEIVSPGISVNNKNVKANITGGRKDIKILPQFELSSLDSIKQNETLVVSGKSTIDKSDTERTLTAKIMQDDIVIAEKNPTLVGNRYNVVFDVTEDLYSVGDYDFVMTYGNQTAKRTLKVTEKPAEPTVTPDKDNSSDNKNDNDDKEDNKKDDKNDSSGTNKDNNTTKPVGGGTVSGIGGGTSSDKNNTSDKDSKNDTNKDDSSADNNDKNDNQNVKYPTDIADHWANQNIKYVYDNALMNGYSDGTFLPEGKITRGEFAAVMSRLLKLDQNQSVADKFIDCSNHWAKGYVGALVDKGIVNGVSDNQFMPDNNISRQEMAVILARAYNLKGESEVFADDNLIADWAKDSVYAVKNAKIMQGDDYNNFAPDNGATRAEVATVISRLHKNK